MDRLEVHFPTVRTDSHARGTFVCEWTDEHGDARTTDKVSVIHEEDQRVMREARERIAEMGGPVEVVIDLRGSNYVNSARLSCIVRIRQAAIEQEGHVVALVDSDEVRNAFVVTKLDKLIEMR